MPINKIQIIHKDLDIDNMKRKLCCLCNSYYRGYGNNAEPLSSGICCNSCNGAVIIERIKQQRSQHRKLIKKEEQ